MLVFRLRKLTNLCQKKETHRRDWGHLYSTVFHFSRLDPPITETANRRKLRCWIADARTTALRLERFWNARGQPQAVLVPDEALGALTHESVLRKGGSMGIQRAKRDWKARERRGAPCCGLTPTQRCRRRPRTSPGRTASGLGPRTEPPPAQTSRLAQSKRHPWIARHPWMRGLHQFLQRPVGLARRR